MTAEQLREIQAETESLARFINDNREKYIAQHWWREDAAGIKANNNAATLLSELYRLRHRCMECECFGKKPTPCEYEKGRELTVNEREDQANG